MLSFHIEFEDGSNPYYHFPCPEADHKKALSVWRRMYELTLIGKSGTIEFYRAKEKAK